MAASAPRSQQPGSVTATAPQIGTVDAALSHTPQDTWELWLRTSEPLAAGSILPLKLTLTATGEQLAAIFRVDRPMIDRGQPNLVVSPPTEDPRLGQTFARWLAAAPLADGPDLDAAIVDVAPAPDARPKADGPALDHLIVDVSPAVAPPQDASRHAASEATRRAANEAARQRAGAALRQAANAERCQDWETAFGQLEAALAAYPVNAVQLHLRMARLALGPLADLPRAKLHAAAAQRLAPEAPEARFILREIANRSRAGAAASTAEAPSGQPAAVRPSRLRVLLAAASLTGLTAAAGWTTWSFFLPHGPKPREVKVDSVGDLMPATRVQLHRASLFVTATGAWPSMTRPAKRQALERLAARARRLHSVSRVVVISAEGRLLGTAEQGRVRVLR